MKMNVCEGCGRIIDEPQTFGTAIKRDYCPQCANVVRKFTEDRDALHDRLAHMWQQKIGVLKRRARKKVKELPDE